MSHQAQVARHDETGRALELPHEVPEPDEVRSVDPFTELHLDGEDLAVNALGDEVDLVLARPTV